MRLWEGTNSDKKSLAINKISEWNMLDHKIGKVIEEVELP